MHANVIAKRKVLEDGYDVTPQGRVIVNRLALFRSPEVKKMFQFGEEIAELGKKVADREEGFE